MGCEPGDFVSETLWWDYRYFIADFFIGMKVEGKTWIELQDKKVRHLQRLNRIKKTFSIITRDAFLTVRVRTRPWKC